MSSHTIIEQSYQEGGHCKSLGGNGAVYQNETLRGRDKESKRKYWQPEAIERCSKIEGCVGISYNGRCHSVYLHSEIDPTLWRNINTPTFRGRPSNRHKKHTLIIF
jgi:hypothetical protein